MAFNSIIDAVNKFNSGSDDIMFIHIREPEEIKRVVDKFGALSLLIKRENQSKITSNYSDASVDNYNYDYVIINTTLEKYEKEAKKFVKELMYDK